MGHTIIEFENIIKLFYIKFVSNDLLGHYSFEQVQRVKYSVSCNYKALYLASNGPHVIKFV